MSAPTASGPFAALEDLKDTLSPLFADDLALFFLPWAAENLENSLAGSESFTVTLGKDAVQLAPLRSAARSFRELRRKFVAGQTVETLKAFTDETTTTIFLLRPQRADARPAPAMTPAADDDEGAPAAKAEADAPLADEAAPESGEGRSRRRRRRRGGRGASVEAGLTLDEGADGEEAPPVAFSDEGVEVDQPSAEDDVPPTDAGSSTS